MVPSRCRPYLGFVLVLATQASACTSPVKDAGPSAGPAPIAGQGGVRPDGEATAGATGSSGIPAAGAIPGISGTPLANAPAQAYVGARGGPGDAYTLVGRFDSSIPAAPAFSLPNSRIGGSFTGDSLAVVLTGAGNDYVSVQVDALPEVVLATSPATNAAPYPVATNLGAGTHTAWLTKRTESYERSQLDPNEHTDTLVFGGFVLAPGGTMAAPPKPQSRLIIAVGDSGFTGYGAGQLSTPAAPCVYSPATQNATLSVPAILAQMLSAEVINVSGSGKGIAASAYDPNNPQKQLPAMWAMTTPFKVNPPYPFPPLPVDAIILDGGSNDLVGAYGVGAFADTNVFIAKYTALLTDMRAHYPSALIVGIINPNAMDQDKVVLTQAIGAAVTARTQAGDTRVFGYDYFAGDTNGWVTMADAENALAFGHGCQGHPTPAGATFLATRLAAFLRAPTPLKTSP